MSLPSGGQEQRYLPVALDSLDFCALEMDLYLKSKGGGDPTLYRAGGLEFTPADARRLAEQGVEFVYIRVAQHAAYRKMLTHKLEGRVKDPGLQHEERWKAVRSSCDQMIKDVLLLPGKPETIESVADISRAFAEWSLDESLGFSYMLDMSEHDFYTTSHMVNVGVGCGLLLKQLKPGNTEHFATVVQGGMLHDVGKRGIPESVLNKEGKLDPQEWELMQTHPVLGYAELEHHQGVSPIIPLMARDHHERIDGKGYPHALTGEQISFEAKICAVVDVYDAITAARPYRGPIAPKDALGMMKDGRGTQFEPEIYDAWCAVVERMVAEDPQRAVKQSAPGAVRPLKEIFGVPVLPHLTDSDRRALDPSVGERRRHKRFAYQQEMAASFVHQGKSLPIRIGEEIRLRTVDISQGGVGVRTPWPFSLGDILHVRFPGRTGDAHERLVKVVRVRRLSDGGWMAGCLFIESARAAA